MDQGLVKAIPACVEDLTSLCARVMEQIEAMIISPIFQLYDLVRYRPNSNHDAARNFDAKIPSPTDQDEGTFLRPMPYRTNSVSTK